MLSKKRKENLYIRYYNMYYDNIVYYKKRLQQLEESINYDFDKVKSVISKLHYWQRKTHLLLFFQRQFLQLDKKGKEKNQNKKDDNLIKENHLRDERNNY